MRKIYINGFFLQPCLSSTGMYRFATNLLLEIDKLNPDILFTIIVPDLSSVSIVFKNIHIVEAKSKFDIVNQKEILWVNVVLNKYCNGYLINLCNFAPIFKNNQLVVLHDVIPFVYPTECSFLWRTYFKFMVKQYLKHKVDFVSVSEFSANEIRRVTNSFIDIGIVSNGIEHMLSLEPDDSVLQDLAINASNVQYVLTINSQITKQYKNIKIIHDLAIRFPEVIFVVVGRGASFANIRYTSYISDNQLKSLLIKAKLFIFPSLYEGFGVPILEAIACNTPMLLSDIAVFREITNNQVSYFNPLDLEDLANQFKFLIANSTKPNYDKLMSKYSWHQSALNLISLVSKV